MDRCDDAALSRWRTDEHRYPPCQYLLSAGIVDAMLSHWRPANVRDREVLLRFKAGHTASAITAAVAEAYPLRAQDARATLLGTSPHAGIVAYLFWELLHQQGFA